MNLQMTIPLGSKDPVESLNPLRREGAFVLYGNVAGSFSDLTVQVVPQGSLQEVGIMEPTPGSYLINVYERQLSELEAIRDQFNAVAPSDYAEFAKGEHMANLLASNGVESVQFGFKIPEAQG